MSLQVRSVRLGPVSFRARPRTWLVAALAWGIALAGAIAVLFSGSVNMTPEQFWAALVGVGERADMLLLWEFRMPRALTGLVVGACLGTAGCLFQALSRDALGSPEIIGLTGGAALGAVASVMVFRSSGGARPPGRSSVAWGPPCSPGCSRPGDSAAAIVSSSSVSGLRP